MKKTGSVVVIVWAIAFGLAACTGRGSGSVELTTSPTVSEVATTGSTEPAAPGEATTLPPTTTSVPTEIPTTTTPIPDVPPQWIWAWLQDPAQIVAISTDGRVNVLLDTPDPATLNSSTMWQVAPDKAIAMYLDGSAPTAYLLTTTDATELAFPSVHMAAPENAWTLVAVSGPYVVIRYPYGVSEAAVLINSDTAEATLLASNVADLNRAAMFSADGRYLRFVTTAGSGTPSRVVERDLTTGQDRTLYSYSNFDHVFADATGEVWLDYRTGDIVAADGRATNGRHSTSATTGRWLAGDWFMTYDFGCGVDCPLTLVPVFGSEPALTYIIPEKTVDRGLASWALDDQSLLVLDAASSSFWRLTGDGGGQLVGHGDPYQAFTALPNAPYAVISTDAGEPVTYQALLKVQTGEIIPLPVAAENPGELWLENQTNGLLLTQYRSDDSQSVWVMLYDTESFAALPADADTYCYVLLANGSAICYSSASPENEGVHRYEPSSGTLTKISDLTVYFLALQRSTSN